MLRLAPNATSSHVNLATCYNPLGRYADALKHYDRAFELEPSWIATPNINHEYGFVLVRAGDVARARATFERVLGLRRRPRRCGRSRCCDMYEGKYRAATARLDEALVLNTAAKNASMEARNRVALATAYEQRGKPAEARRELSEAKRVALAGQASLTVISRVGVALARAGRLADAEAMRSRHRRSLRPTQRSTMSPMCAAWLARSR